MKKSIYTLLAFLFVLLIVVSCTKQNNQAPKSDQLIAGKTMLRLRQPDSVVYGGVTDAVSWSVTPAGFNSVFSKSNKAVFTFSKPGTYTVKGSIGANTRSTSITVTDTVATPVTPVTYSIIPLTGDQITLDPYVRENVQADSAYLYFVAKTTNSYCGTSTLEIASSLNNNTYSMSFLNVVQPDVCVLGESPIAGEVYYTTNQPSQLVNGTYPLSVVLNGITYTGSIVISSTTITYNWNYTSGVVISSKQINR